MKKFCLFLLFLLSLNVSNAQYNELGLFLGGANPIADIGRETYVYPNRFAIGGIYKRNLHPKLSIRADLKLFSLEDKDQFSDILGKKKRNFSFQNKITEYALGVEYNFFDFDTHSLFKVLFTPYIYTGVVYFRQDDLFFRDITLPEQTALKTNNKRIGTWALPLNLGVKTRIGESRLIIGAEVGLRYAFTNNLDGSHHKDFQKFGNVNSNDWYVVSGIYINYTFGQRPCLCY